MTVADQRAPAAVPTVSVVVPAYNVAAYLDKSVGSALAQDVDVEVLVVDDGSTDDGATAGAIRRLEAADPRVRGFRLPVNGGPSAARNKGLDEARGEWIAFLDADDWFAPGRLAYLLEVARTAGADVVTDDLALINEGADKPWATIYEVTGWTQADEGRILSAAEMCRWDWILQPMFRSAWLRAHGLRFHTVRHSAGEDFEFYMNALLCGAKWVAARRPMYFYMSRPGQLTRDRSIADGLIESAEAMAQDIRIQRDAELARAFADRLDRVRAAQWVGQLADAVRGRHWLRAAAMMARSPRRIANAATALWRRRLIAGMLRRNGTAAMTEIEA